MILVERTIDLDIGGEPLQQNLLEVFSRQVQRSVLQDKDELLGIGI